MTVPMYTQAGWTAAGAPLLWASVSFSIAVFVFERWLDLRQHRRIAERGALVPDHLRELVAAIDADAPKAAPGAAVEETLLKRLEAKGAATKEYSLAKSRFRFVTTTFSLAQALVQVGTGFYPYMWDVAVGLVCGAGADDACWRASEIRVAVVFAGLLTLVETVISLPFSVYSTFRIEQQHGFNTMTYSLFAADAGKSLALTGVIGAPVLSLLLAIVRSVGPQRLASYVAAFMFTVSLFFATIYPVAIQPLFNKYEPLAAGPLREKIEKLAASVNYPLYKLFTVDGSKRSSHSNAYMYGFFKFKRIVLFDTLLKQASDDEITAILAHELGHWSYGHTVTGFAITQGYFFVAFTAFSKAMGYADMYAAFGFAATAGASATAGAPVVVGLILFFSTLWEPADHFISFCLTANTRRMEFQADAYAADLGRAAPLQRGLVKITFENLGMLDPDPFYSAYHHSPPPLMERLAAIDEKANKSK